MGIADIHGHYAFGIDDGAKTIEDTKKLLKYAKENGVSHIAMTPHIKPGKMDDDFMSEYYKAMKETSQIAKDYGIQALVGSELLLNDLTYDYLKNKQFYSLNNTKYLLVECDINKDFEDTKQFYLDLLYEIEISGYTPVIAHVERYFKEIDLEIIKHWIHLGYVIQMNIQSLYDGSASEKKNAITLLKHGYVHILASDSHSVNNFRKPSFNKGIKELSKYCSKEEIKTLLKENPIHILKGEKVKSLVKGGNS